ncbi:CBO0543 family protein [Alkalihalobacillus sp. BA299]|uniref:CBO0543 family protein n=1 Tax=Alkalihalobacillus sp. BA299 TaxID=2815938 RepID=UPI001ADD527F|nr:CBO0543 family protein [Alkalihalobacillus sp. BA299]
MIIPEKVSQKINDAYQLLVSANQIDHAIWLEYVFLSWQWWLCVVLSTLPWLFWYKFRQKKSTNRLLLGGFFIISISMFLDSLGSELNLWDYRYEVIPFLPSFMPWDLSLLPVLFLFIVQIKPNVHPLLKAFLFSIICAFIGEPLFKWLGFYNAINWNEFYSFTIYIVLYLIGHRMICSKNFEEISE